MTPLEAYFDKIIVINLAHRKDKWREVQEEMRKHYITKYERFEGHDTTAHTHGESFYGGGNMGCTASHRGILELICHHKWKRTLILEDDFRIRHDDFNTRFAAMASSIPVDWDMLYLGGHYSEKPQYRVNPHIIRINRMATTSSYAVTYEMARLMAPHIAGVGPIDSLYWQWHLSHRCYIFEPRLMVQGNTFSDINNRQMNNGPCMEDENHVKMLEDDTITP